MIESSLNELKFSVDLHLRKRRVTQQRIIVQLLNIAKIVGFVDPVIQVDDSMCVFRSYGSQSLQPQGRAFA